MTLTATREGTPSTAVVLGGTGMLWPLCIKLAEQGSRVHAVGRQPRSADSVKHVTSHAADWHDRASYLTLLEELAALAPAYVIAWLHSDSAVQHDEALAALKPNVYLEVFGSASFRQCDAGLLEATPCLPGIRRQRVILGEHRDHTGARWLTHEQISAGVFKALTDGEPVSVVGDLPI